MLSQRIASLATCLTLFACGAPPPSGAVAPPKPTGDLITAAELANVPQSDLYAAIQQLRSGFFRTRGVTSPGMGAQDTMVRNATATEFMHVFVNGTSRGGIDALHQIYATDVKEVRRLSASEATQRFGTGNTMGAIVVTLK